MYRMSSSLRQVPIAETLKYAKILAPRLGITRVTNTTRLDKIGIPVFASIRPKVQPGSLCVNAGKGIHIEEAQIGAYMEAIEFATAEYGASKLKFFLSTPKEIFRNGNRSYSFVDFCPCYGRLVDPNAPIACIEAEEVLSGTSTIIPAELVFIPFHENPAQRLFGTSTNGLSSGNSVLEASIHGLAEVMERDVQAFNYIEDRSRLVLLDVEDSNISPLIQKILSADLEVSVRYTENPFGLAYFQAFILEKSNETPISISCGSALHPIRTIAMVRAICEAAQSRLSHIHGGRDDIIERVHFFRRVGRAQEIAGIERLRKRALDNTNPIFFSTIPDFQPNVCSLLDAWEILNNALQYSGVEQILRVIFTESQDPLQVVKIIVPKLESFEAVLKRVGPRLRDYVKNRK